MQIHHRQRFHTLLTCIVVCTAVFAASTPMFISANERSSAAAHNQQADSRTTSSLDFKTYRTRIEPIFLKMRQGNVRCYDCHSVTNTRLRLQPLTAGETTWSEEQSRQNFEVGSRLVTPNEPMKSPLLLHPLAPEAGGDPTHTGGKFWASQNDQEWQMIAAWVGNTASSVTAQPHDSKDSGDQASFESFRVNVEPIFLKERPGHARCYGCHTEGNRVFHLGKLSAGSEAWTEQQSWLNFQNVLQLVTPGDPTSSRLLTHPLAPESGGEAFHSGGRQFASQNDPDFLKIAEWVNSLSPTAITPKVRLYVTNSAGNTVDVIDPATNKTVQTIDGIAPPHGLASTPEGPALNFKKEPQSVLDVVDGNTGHILEKLPLGGHPNNLTITKDGKRVLVGIRESTGWLEVFDTASLKKTKSIPLSGPVHNVYVTPDGKYAVAGSIDAKNLTVVDLQTEQAVWNLNPGSGVRPMTFETNPDGSTKRIFAQLSGFNGFAVVDFAKH